MTRRLLLTVAVMVLSIGTAAFSPYLLNVGGSETPRTAPPRAVTVGTLTPAGTSLSTPAASPARASRAEERQPRTAQSSVAVLVSPTPARRPGKALQSASGWHTLGSELALLRQCEASGDYRAVNPSGRYRGAYQFDRETWASVGGHGDPAAASRAEQDRRAVLLHALRGWAPWPQCSARLGLGR